VATGDLPAETRSALRREGAAVDRDRIDGHLGRGGMGVVVSASRSS
jgi:hypothetical protein